MVNFHRLWSTTLGPSYGGLFSTTVLVAPDWLGSNSTYRAGQRVVVGPVADAPVNGMLFILGPVVPLASLFRCFFSLHLLSRRAAEHVQQKKGIHGTSLPFRTLLFAACIKFYSRTTRGIGAWQYFLATLDILFQGCLTYSPWFQELVSTIEETKQFILALWKQFQGDDPKHPPVRIYKQTSTTEYSTEHISHPYGVLRTPCSYTIQDSARICPASCKT